MLFFLRPSAAPAAIVPLGTAAGQSTGTLALTAPTQVPLSTGAAQSAATLALKAQTYIPLGAGAAQSTATLVLTSGPGIIGFFPAAAQSAATLALTAPTRIPLGAAAAQSTGALTVSTPTAAIVALQASAALADGSLAFSAKTTVVLQSSAGQSTGSLLVRIPGAPLPGKFVLTNAYVAIGGVDISRFCTDVEVASERGEIDVTPFGATYREFMGGPTESNFRIVMFADPTITTPSFWASLKSGVPVEVRPRGLSAGPLWTATAVAFKQVPFAGQVGEASKATIELRATADIIETF